MAKLGDNTSLVDNEISPITSGAERAYLVDISKILSTVHSPLESTAVYQALAEDEDFPVGAVFDWSQLKR